MYQLVYIPMLTYGHKLWYWLKGWHHEKTAEMSFLQRVPGLNLRDRVSRLDVQGELGVKLLFLHIKRGQLRWFGSSCMSPGLDASLWRYSGHVQMVGDPEADVENARGITYLSWLGNALGSPLRHWRALDVLVSLLSQLPLCSSDCKWQNMKRILQFTYKYWPRAKVWLTDVLYFLGKIALYGIEE